MSLPNNTKDRPLYDPFTGGPTLSLNYRFDANGNLTNLWSGSSGGVTNVYQFDALNRLTNVLANGSAAAGYGFDAVGNLQSVRYGNGVTNQFQYDPLNRLTNMVWKLNASTVASFYYQLGLAGNRTNLSETVNSTSRTYGWTFDPLYRLKQETLGGGTSGTLSYGFDPVGNRTNRTSSVTGLTNQSFTFNTNDWLTSESYDNNGNTTNSSGNFYQYDALNHVTNVNSGTVLLVYDGDGNRVKKTVGGTTTYYLLDDQNPSGYVQVLEEWTSTGTPALSKIYNYGLQLISQRQPNVSTNYFVFDGHGSTRVLADIAGNVVNAFTFDAYGNLIASNAAPQTVYLYAGQQFDPDLGVYYLRTRLSNPGTGRFLTSDEVEGDEERPTSLHRYTLCENDPVNNVDPNGADIGEVLAVADIGGMLAQISNPVAGRVQQRAVAVTNPRPSSASFWKEYLNYSISQQDVWRKHIGGNLGRWGDTPTPEMPNGQNSCATRVSRGLNYGGAPIASGAPERWGINKKNEIYQNKNGDGKYYITSAGRMNTYLKRIWGNPPDKTLNTAEEVKAYINSLPEGRCAIFATRPERPRGEGHSGVLKKGYQDPYVEDEVSGGPIDVWLLPQ